MKQAKPNDGTSVTNDASIVTVPIFTPVAAPMISDTAHGTLVRRMELRDGYEAKMRARAASTGEALESIMIRVKDSIEPSLLDGLCDFVWGLQRSELTDKRVMEEITKITITVKNGMIPDINALFKRELRMDFSHDDVSSRVLQYFLRCRSLIKEHDLAQCFADANGKREQCRLLIACLEPTALREEVSNLVQFHQEHKGARHDESALHRLVVERATEQEKSFNNRRESVTTRASLLSNALREEPLGADSDQRLLDAKMEERAPNLKRLLQTNPRPMVASGAARIIGFLAAPQPTRRRRRDSCKKLDRRRSTDHRPRRDGRKT